VYRLGALGPRRDRGARADARLASRPRPRRRSGVLRLPARRIGLPVVIQPSERRRRKRRRSLARPLAALAAALILLGLGIALGEALRDNPKPNLTVTSTKTIVP